MRHIILTMIIMTCINRDGISEIMEYTNELSILYNYNAISTNILMIY